MPIGGLLTVVDIARRTSRDPESVRRWIRSDRLPATKVGNMYFITNDDFQAFKPPVPRGRVNGKPGKANHNAPSREKAHATRNAETDE